MTTYYEELTRAMEMIAAQPRSIFLGQSILYGGTGMTNTFRDVPREKLLELPVFEECQLGMSIGMAMDGMLPVSVFPRWNFLVCAMNQLVNHLDKIPVYSSFAPKVIIRVASGCPVPLDPGLQHLGDFGTAVAKILRTVTIIEMRSAMSNPVYCYKAALERAGSTIVVEYPELYNVEG